MFIFVEDDSNNPLNTSVNMYIFPKNTKFVLCAILISVLYLFVTISSSIRYIDNKVEESRIDIRRKLLLPSRDVSFHTKYYYDAIKNMPRPNIFLHHQHLPMTKVDIPSPYNVASTITGEEVILSRDEMAYNMFKDIKELYWIVPYNANDNSYLSSDNVPWILECNNVSGCDSFPFCWWFQKSHIYPIAVGFKNYSANKQIDATQALYNVYNDYLERDDTDSSASYIYQSSELFTPSYMKNRYHSTQAYNGSRHGGIKQKISEQDYSVSIDSLPVDASSFRCKVFLSNNYIYGYDCGNCVVYLQDTYHTDYEVQQLVDKIEEDKAICICASVLSWIILLFITIGVYKKFRQKEIAKIQKPLYKRLYDACNPKLFLKPYDQQKVVLAGEIRKQISLHKDSEEAIHELYMKAKNELGINVLDNHRLDQLEKLVNPSHFMQQGDEQNFLLANELYAKLENREALLYNDYLMIEQEVTRLYQSTE